MGKNNFRSCCLLVILILLPSVFSLKVSAWETIKECDSSKILIEKSDDEHYRLIMRGDAVDYFMSRNALPFKKTKDSREFYTDLFKYQGHFRSIVKVSEEKNISLDLYDYGHITLIATENPNQQDNRAEIAAWNYRYCR